MANGPVGAHAGDPLGDGPFRRSHALAHAITVDGLRSGQFVRLRRDCYVRASAAGGRTTEIVAVLTVMPDDAAIHGLTAAEWYGLPAPRADAVHVIVPAGGVVPRRREGVVTHEGLGAADATFVDGVRVTTPERTFLDLSLVLPKAELVVVGDAMVANGLTTPQRLADAALQARRRRNVLRARTAARLIRGRVDSPQESRLRVALIDDDLPEPVVNPDITDGHGGWIGRPDLAYLELKIAIQYEGDVHRTNKRRWRADVGRDGVLVDHGWEVIRVTADDLRRPWLLCARIRRAIDRRQAELARPPR